MALRPEQVVSAPLGHQSGGQVFGRAFGDEADGAAGGVAAVEGALRSAQDLDPVDVEDQALGHDRDRIGDLVHIDADGGRVVRGVVLEADAAQAELGRAAAEGRLDLQVGRGVLQLVDVGDALLDQAFAAEDAEGDAHVLGRLFAPLGGDDDLVDRRGPIRRRLLGHGGGGTQGRERPGGYADQKTIHRLIPPMTPHGPFSAVLLRLRTEHWFRPSCIYPRPQKLCNAASVAVCLTASRCHPFVTHEVAGEMRSSARLFLEAANSLTNRGFIFFLLSIPINRNAGVRRWAVCRR
ncbi:hypothetical protein D3C72_749040 [compost metagenome]